MQMNNLRGNSANRGARRVGRGGKRGTYSGRGIKGLGARAGGKFRPEERDTLKKIPKLRGYRFKPFRSKPVAVNGALLAHKFGDGEIISPKTLCAKGLVRRVRGRIPEVKILGGGSAVKQFIFEDVSFSRSAAEKFKV